MRSTTKRDREVRKIIKRYMKGKITSTVCKRKLEELYREKSEKLVKLEDFFNS